jgi:predicted ester cyclase
MQTRCIAVIAALAACTTAPTPRPPMTPTTTDTNKQIVRTLYEDCINPGRLERISALVADDYVGPQGDHGPAGFAANVAGLRTGFPDIHFTIDDLVAEGDRVSVRWTWHATHTGPFRGVAPTGKPVTNTGIAIYQLVSRKIVANWLETDRLGALQQIGVFPAGGPATVRPPR